MQFTMIVEYDDKKPVTPNDTSRWREPMNRPEIKTEDAAREYAQRIIKNFNATLHPKERPRRLVDVEFGDNGVRARHAWEKQNNMTLQGRGGFYDEVKCSRCGVTGKRFGIGGHHYFSSLHLSLACGVTGKRFGIGGEVRLDSNFRAKAFEACDTAKALLLKRAEKARASALVAE